MIEVHEDGGVMKEVKYSLGSWNDCEWDERDIIQRPRIEEHRDGHLGCFVVWYDHLKFCSNLCWQGKEQ